MKIVIRVDSSPLIGSGHLVRCQTLAEALRKRGADVQFICRDHPGNLVSRLTRSGFKVTLLPAPPPVTELREDYALWLGVPPEVDARETGQALAGERPDWLIVDHYGLDHAWETQLRSQVDRIFVIDDLANRCHDCDVLLDHNENVKKDSRYQGLVPTSCRLLLGCRYALLSPEYAQFRALLTPPTGKIERVFIFFGGTDPQNLTGKAIAALSSPEFSNLSLDVVIGTTNPHRLEIEVLASNRPRTTLHSGLPHLAALMTQADLAIGAGGTTTWERLCLGLPTLVVSVAENQVPACQALGEAGMIIYLGSETAFSLDTLRTAIASLLANPASLIKISELGTQWVDGLGAMRVAEYLIPTSKEQLQLRPAQLEDQWLYYAWVNEPEVRRQSLQSNPIAWEDHQVWFQRKLADSHCYLGVLEANNLPVGQIRFDLQADTATINYSLDIFVRGRGWAKRLIVLGIEKLQGFNLTYLIATVKINNQASRAVFSGLGFKEELQAIETSVVHFRLLFSSINT